MSEAELPTGRDSIEQDLGGREPLPAWNPTPDEPKEYDRGDAGIVEASNDLSRERGPTEDPLIKITDRRHDSDDRKYYTTAEEAGRDLNDYHRTLDATEATENLQELAREVDLARSQVAGVQHPQPEQQQAAPIEAPQPQQSDAPQPEYGEQPSGLDPEVSAALQNPKVRAVIEASVAPAEQARQQYAAATAQVAGMLVAELAADLPEIVSLPPEQRLVGLQILQKQQPERFAAVEAKAGRIHAVYNAQLQNNAYEAHQRQQQYKAWAKGEDDRLLAKAPEAAELEISRAALKSLKAAGFSEEELARAWQGEPFSMRDHRAQLLILKAAKYDEAMANAHANPSRQLPPVQRPGIAPSAGERSAVDLSELRSEFKRATGNEQLRLAAKLHQAQRRARG